MKKIIILISIISLTNSYAGCVTSLRSFLGLKNNSFYDTPEFALKEKVNALEKLNNRLRNSSDNKEPALTTAIWKKIERLDNNIFTKHYTVNVRDWEVFFRDFEINYISFNRLKKILDFIDADTTQESLRKLCQDSGYSKEFEDFIVSKFSNATNVDLLKIELEKEIEGNLIHIGNHYYEYRLVREHLRDLKGSDLCNADCETELKKLLSSLGVANKKEQSTFPIFLKGEKRPDLDELTQLVHENPLALVTKLKKERNIEVVNWMISLMLQPEIIDTIMGMVYKSKTIGKYRAVRVFQAFYNAQARNLHFPKINSVVKTFRNDLEKSYAHLKTLNTTIPKDEMLVTFARMVDALAVKKWKLLKNYAKANDPKFLERMLEAEKKAFARGDISITHKRSLIGQLIQFIPASTPIYLYQRSKLEEHATVTEVDENGDAIESSETGQSVSEVDPVIVIEHDGEVDQDLEEVAEVIATAQEAARDPSSVKTSWLDTILSKIRGLF